MDAHGNPVHYNPVPRVRPAPYTEYFPGRGWMRGGRPVRNIKPHYSFIWPRDGHQPLHRLRDILTNRGPDIHLSITADKRLRPFDRPTKSRWSEWTVFDDAEGVANDNSIEGPAWAKREGGKKYDFRTRRWRRPEVGCWSDVAWEGGWGKWPRAMRDVEGRWLEGFPQYRGWPQYPPFYWP